MSRRHVPCATCRKVIAVSIHSSSDGARCDACLAITERNGDEQHWRRRGIAWARRQRLLDRSRLITANKEPQS